jgi:hypothetical protein
VEPTFDIAAVDSAKYVASLLRFGAEQAKDTRIVMDRIIADMFMVEKAVFRGQGRRGGGSWAALKPDTIRKKGIGGINILRTDLANPGYSKIGESPSSDTLFKSVTEPDAPYQIKAVRNNSILFGTKRPFAGAHQYGSFLRYIPARPFIKFTNLDADRWTQMIFDHLMTTPETR